MAALKICSIDSQGEGEKPATIDLRVTERENMKERTRERERVVRAVGRGDGKGQDGDSAGMQQK